ncbi:MAG: hypothetical protein GY737_27120 [Desulfobacteraceae bacterium]|nr:hypothetical protein [Desulfobacteraceae bacterium]
MKRSRQIIVVCHCLLNANAKIHPLANYAGVKEEVMLPCLKQGAGIVQLPCPETTYLGMNRWGMTVEQYDNPGYVNHCRRILEPSLDEIQAFHSAGYEIICVIGVDGSPSCGVNQTCTGFHGGEISSMETLAPQIDALKLVNGQGVFIREFKALLEQRNISLTFHGVDEEAI